jgi:hypothetical protein
MGTRHGAVALETNETRDWIEAHAALSRLAQQRAALDAEEGRWLLCAFRSAGRSLPNQAACAVKEGVSAGPRLAAPSPSRTLLAKGGRAATLAATETLHALARAVPVDAHRCGTTCATRSPATAHAVHSRAAPGKIGTECAGGRERAEQVSLQDLLQREHGALGGEGVLLACGIKARRQMLN